MEEKQHNSLAKIEDKNIQEYFRKEIQSLEANIDNPYTFSDRQFRLEQLSHLAQTTIIKSDLQEPEIEWCLQRLAKIDQIDAMLPDVVVKMDSNGIPHRDKNNKTVNIANIWKQKAMIYMLKRVVDRGIMSRTKDGWFLKLILGFKDKEKRKEEGLTDIIGKTDEELEHNKDGPNIGPNI